MTDDFDLDWLAARQPAAAAPDATATAAARAALLDHADATAAAPPRTTAAAPPHTAAAAPPAAPKAAPLPATRRRERRRTRRRVAALAVATVAVVGVAAVGLPLELAGKGDSGDGLRVATDHGGPLAPAVADAAPLKRLSARVAALPDQPGDATLVVHTNTFPDGDRFTGADLYLDDGTYYYATTAAGLRGPSGEQPIDMPFGEIVAATRRATTLGPQQARAGFLRAVGFVEDPGPPAAGAPSGTQKRLPTKPPLSLRQREDNMIWVSVVDVLAAGGSRADVRAGALRLLATVPTVTLEDITNADGERVLRLRSTDPRQGERYVETLYLDAGTGVMKRFVGGVDGQPPDVVVSYAIERVDAATVRGR